MKRIVIGIFLAVLAGFAQAQSEKLGVGDAVRVTVFQQPDLTTEARISERGTISMPLVGEQKLAGLSQSEAGAQIAEALKKGEFLKNPQVAVAITIEIAAGDEQLRRQPCCDRRGAHAELETI